MTMKEYIKENYDTGKAGFTCNIAEPSTEYEESIRVCKELGIEYEVESDNPGEVWFRFIR